MTQIALRKTRSQRGDKATLEGSETDDRAANIVLCGLNRLAGQALGNEAAGWVGLDIDLRWQLSRGRLIDVSGNRSPMDTSKELTNKVWVRWLGAAV